MKLKSLLIVSFIVAISSMKNLSAQVTIGTDKPPAKGALLDLKSKDDGTSTKGLLLPRMKLIKLTDADISNIKEGVSVGSYQDTHTGWVV